MTLIAWSFAGVAGYNLDPDWPWMLLLCYGPVSLVILWASLFGTSEPRPLWDRILCVALAIACVVMVVTPAVGRMAGCSWAD